MTYARSVRICLFVSLLPSPRRRSTEFALAHLGIALSLVLLAGCGAVPVIVPDMSLHAHRAPRLEGAHGPLSSQQSLAILAGLKSSGEATTTFQRHVAIEEAIVGSPLVVGNKVTLLLDGADTYPSMLAAIKAAKHNINMETYIIDDDEVGREFAAALLERQRAGVQVNLIYDSLGALNTSKDFFKPLIDGGVNVLEFNPLNPLSLRKGWDVDQRDHRKLLMVDGQIVFIGGINISSVYSNGSFKRKSKTATKSTTPWRDTHVRIEGPAVKEFQKLFLETWEKQKGTALAAEIYLPEVGKKGNEVVRAIGASPDEPYSLTYAALLTAITNAENQIYLTNAYFVPDPQLLAALKDAAHRGVDVQLLLPGKTDSALITYVSHSFYDELLSAGIKIFERQHALLHAKTAVIDGVWSTIGSTNLDWRSLVHNQEVNAVILGPDFGAKMQSTFEQDVSASTPIMVEQWRRRSLLKRIKEAGARLWARVL